MGKIIILGHDSFGKAITHVYRDKERKILVERLKRIFPKIEMMFPTKLFNDEKDCSPEYSISWYQFLEKLEQNGLGIINSKQK